MKTRSFGERVDEKSAQALFANHLRERYHYNPAMAEAIFRDALFVRTLLDPTAREDGQVVRYFPKATESAGKPLRDCAYVAVRLTMYAPGDDEFLARYGPKALRQRKIKRLCDEAIAQGAAATQEDLAALFCCHRSTIVRDIAELKAKGLRVVTRAGIRDQGRGLSHKREAILLYLQGYLTSEIARKIQHTCRSVSV